MTTLIVTPAKKAFSVTINDVKESVNHLKFVCYSNSLHGDASWDGLDQVRAEAKVANAVRAYARLEEKPKYFVALDSTSKLDDRIYAVVYSAKEEFNGTTNDNDFSGLEEVGILLKDGNKWITETNLENIELIRRELEINGLKDGSRHIGFEGSISGDKDGNAIAYTQHLAKLDAENGGKMVTRGWHIS